MDEIDEKIESIDDTGLVEVEDVDNDKNFGFEDTDIGFGDDFDIDV
ncbi:MAG: hypothetical protein L3J69_12330 [Desulfobacula sp.]|nr:hypothetical protein [Desulfobacula sp.]